VLKELHLLKTWVTLEAICELNPVKSAGKQRTLLLKQQTQNSFLLFQCCCFIADKYQHNSNILPTLTCITNISKFLVIGLTSSLHYEYHDIEV